MLNSPDGTEIAYTDSGRGVAIVLLHGFASNKEVNWERPGVIKYLVDAGFRVVAADLRGHGRSDASHEVADYAPEYFREDLEAVLDTLGIEEVALVGYSLGARVAMAVAPDEPRVRAVVFGGAGDLFLGPGAPVPGVQAAEHLAIAAALEAPSAHELEAGRPRSFRLFAESTGSDLVALAALQRCLSAWPAPAPGRVRVPAMVLTGDEDDFAGSPEPLAAVLPAGRAVTIAGRHLNVVSNPALAAAIAGFVAEVMG